MPLLQPTTMEETSFRFMTLKEGLAKQHKEVAPLKNTTPAYKPFGEKLTIDA